ncbi:MAG: pentapeptide repeat-containing protein [Alphaproteobacteria bacterium]
MRHYILKTHTNQKTLFSGYYTSFIACLEEAVRQNIDLSHIDLRNTNLSNANLDGAQMPGAYLGGCNLSGINLSESDLHGSIFYNCALYNSCLSYSNLHNSDFRSADFGATLIEGCDITQCIFSSMSCFDLDFHLTENMDGCAFIESNGTVHSMSKQPIIIKGALNTPVIIMDQVIKIGLKVFPKTILPTLTRAINIYAPALLSKA